MVEVSLLKVGRTAGRTTAVYTVKGTTATIGFALSLHFDFGGGRGYDVVGLLLFASWGFLTSCCDVVNLVETPFRVFHGPLLEGDYTLMTKDTEAKCKD